MGRFSKPFFIVGLCSACVLMVLPLLFDSLRNSMAFGLVNLVLFPTSVFSWFSENAAPGVRALCSLLAVFLNAAVFGLLGALLDQVLRSVPSGGRPVPMVPLVDLPVWRRVIIISAFVIIPLALAANLGSDFTIGEFRPIRPNPATGEVYLVYVKPGGARYITLEEKGSLEFWRNLTFELTGPLFMTAFFLWITVRPPKTNTVR